MKRRMITILTVFLLLFSMTPSQIHADELKGLTLENEMRSMMALGIIKGYTNGKVYPKADVNRGDFAAFLARTMKLPNEVPNYKDINKSSAIAGEIGALQKAGIMNATVDGKFEPTKLMTREEMSITMARALNHLNVTINVLDISFMDEAAFSFAEGIQSSKMVYSANIMRGIKISADRKIVTFDPKGISKRDQVAAVLHRFLKYVNEHIEEKPDDGVEGDPTKFQLATIVDGKFVLQPTKYNTYAEVVNAFNSNTTAQGIIKGSELLRVRSGMAFAQGPYGNNTIIYSSQNWSTQLTYIEAGREMRVLEHAENYIKVQVADTVGYVKQNQIDFMPTAISDNRDYYIVNTANELLHYTYNYLSKSYGAYSIGPAPSFMTPSVRYYSSDGVHFLNGAGQAAGTHYPYFQFQSIRSATDYTAEELDAYLAAKLLEQEGVHSRYANASTKSKLLNKGAYLKQMEAEHRVNALFILATAIHESDYGMSSKAQNINNLFGIAVYDSTPEGGTKYASPENSILAFVTQFANRNYGPPAGAYAKGAVPGNKTAGFNVHYASDPTWGAKIAGHMWRIDTAMGKRDYGKHELAMTTTSGSMNARTEPRVGSDTLLFSYQARDLGRSGETGYPLVIVSETTGSDGYVWYQVLSDDPNHEFAWIRSDLVRKLPK